jgi:hypothetical protein
VKRKGRDLLAAFFLSPQPHLVILSEVFVRNQRANTQSKEPYPLNSTPRDSGNSPANVGTVQTPLEAEPAGR